MEIVEGDLLPTFQGAPDKSSMNIGVAVPKTNYFPYRPTFLLLGWCYVFVVSIFDFGDFCHETICWSDCLS